MDSIIEALIKLVPCSEWFNSLGVGKELSVGLATVAHLVIMYLIVRMVDYFIKRYKYCQAASKLDPWFDYQKVKSSREHFIPTRFQNNSPIREDEPAFTHKYVAKNPLIPFFINTAFNEKKVTDKYYLLLADSGMGKTTFMINLYLKYTSFLNFRRKYKMRFFPFGDSRILDKIKEIEPSEVPDTILLLDAFDEDKQLLPSKQPDGVTDEERFRRRLDEIIETVRDFREVIITSRTQYFPGQEDQEYELKIPRFDDKGYHKLAKLYISPFNDKEIHHYINKKYGLLRFWNRRKKRNALSIIKSAPKLMVRPMLLSYIDLLTNSNRIYKNVFQIYEELIARWIEREANKRKHQMVDREKFKSNLLTYSQKVALKIYGIREEDYMLALNKDSALAIARESGIDLSDYEITGQSLLTRDVNGNWKFAHKSILEFFIANEAIKNHEFCAEVDFTGMDMAQHFYEEMYPGQDYVLIRGGKYVMGSPVNENEREGDETQHEVIVDDFYMLKYPVTEEQYDVFIKATGYKGGTNTDDKADRKKHPKVYVTWHDACAYCTWLSKKKNKLIRLPTEAEWEYACRAGSSGRFCFGDDEKELTEYAWVAANSDGLTHPVGQMKPNGFGLYDMHGNVWEWCKDWCGEEYYKQCEDGGVINNPQGPKSGSYRVLRGGGWISDSRRCRCAYRNYIAPGYRNDSIGFRVVLVP